MRATHHHVPTIGGSAYSHTTYEPQEFVVTYRVPLANWHGSKWQAQLIRWKQAMETQADIEPLWASGIKCALVEFQSHLDDTDPLLGQPTAIKWVHVALKLVEAVEAVR
jgi:hypothetical protein